MISKASKDEKLPVYGNGLNVRDWIHVYDHNVGVDMIVRNGKPGETYNLGGHAEKANIEIVKTILGQLDKPEELITYVTDRPGHDLRYAMDPTKIETELGWKPTYNFETGIVPTIEWNLKNQTWLQHVESGEYMKWMERYKK
jgi:dTDP-glucose 4,6-dehydratase